MSLVTPRSLVEEASKRTENSFVKEFLREDKEGSFEKIAEKLLAHDAFCTRPQEAYNQAVDLIRMAALEATLNAMKKGKI